MKTIKSVNGLKVGQVFNVDGMNYTVTSFPTRSTVCGRAHSPESGKPSSVKISLKTPTLFYNHYRTGLYVENTASV